MKVPLSWLLVASALVACDRRPEPEPRVGAPVASPGPSSSSTAATSNDYRFPAAKRLVAIGDLHGDFQATRAALRLAGAIDGADQWVGGSLVVVQTGDQLDRGDEEREILELMDVLATQARKAGGALYSLNGNHETMNVMGDFRYVTEGGLESFAALETKSPLAAGSREPYRSRAEAFLPGGQYALMLAKRPVAIVVGDTLFAHGGVLPSYASRLSRTNREIARWMRGEAKAVPHSAQDPDGVLWTRVYGDRDSDEVCRTADRVLGALGAARMVVGHTVQKHGITSICARKVWRIDVGLAAYYGDGPIQVLEISDGRTQVLSERRQPEAVANPR